eukprot:812799-Amphidinium_carterae.1
MSVQCVSEIIAVAGVGSSKKRSSEQQNQRTISEGTVIEVDSSPEPARRREGRVLRPSKALKRRRCIETVETANGPDSPVCPNCFVRSV